MTTQFPHLAAAALTPAEVFYAHLSSVYALSQENQHVFASPLGPFAYGDRYAWLPRFVFFGPNTTDESWRLAFLAGFDAREDLRASHALLGLVEYLSRQAGDGYGLNLTFFPLVDVAGHIFRAPARRLESVHWARSDAPEIGLLEKDARAARYHGYVRVETAPGGDDMASLRMRAPAGLAPSPDVELLSSDDFESFPIRFEHGGLHTVPEDGPLTIAEDLSVQPFELTLRIPAAWSPALYENAVNAILGRFILRYRAFQAFGGYL